MLLKEFVSTLGQCCGSVGTSSNVAVSAAVAQLHISATESALSDSSLTALGLSAPLEWLFDLGDSDSDAHDGKGRLMLATLRAIKLLVVCGFYHRLSDMDEMLAFLVKNVSDTKKR